MERTFIMIKPDGMERGLAHEVIRRFEQKGYKMVACKLDKPAKEMFAKHYEEHQGKGFYEGLLTYVMSGNVLQMVWEGPHIVEESRKFMGATKPWEAAVGTIRSDFCTDMEKNVIHGSDSVESAKKEIGLWFPNL